MERKSGFEEFARYTAFSVLGTLGVSCYILADTFFISKGLGTKGLAALNLAIPVYNFIHGTGLMLGMGGGTKFSVCKSHGKEEDGDLVYTNTVYLAALFSAAFALPGYFFSGHLAMALGADEQVFGMTKTYLRWLLAFSPAFIFNDVFLCFVRNDESPRLSMLAMITGSFANIVLDYIFIFPMGGGIFGAVLATGLSPVISMAMMLEHRMKKKNTFHLVKGRLEGDRIRQELSLGFPSLIAQVSTGIVMIAFNGIILGLEGNTGVAAYGVVANITLVVMAVYTGIAQGVQPLISRLYGAGHNRQIDTMYRYAMGTMVMVSLAVYLCLFVFAEPITGVFNGENNGQLQRIAVRGLRLYFTSGVFAGYNVILAVFFTSAERALPAHILSVLRGLILIIPIAYCMSFAWGMTGVWLTCPVTECVVAVLGMIMYRKNRKA